MKKKKGNLRIIFQTFGEFIFIHHEQYDAFFLFVF